MAITQDYVAWATGNDYKGATFTDGAFTVADMTLTKAGAFAASKANHWLYLDDNGSGEVTTGYYRIASVTSDNAVVLADSPKSGANDPTDVVCTQHAGTTLLPWRSDQGAVDLCTRNTTDGNQVNIIAGAAVVHTVALDLTTFVAGGALSAAAPLIFRGCTATANDGGMGEIDCGGATMWAENTYDYIMLADLEMHTFGDNFGVYLDDYIRMYRCEVHKGASSPETKLAVRLGQFAEVVGCDVHDYDYVGISVEDYSFVGYNYVHDIVNPGLTSYGFFDTNAGNVIVIGNHFLGTEAGYTGIALTGSGTHRYVMDNNIVCTAASEYSGILMGNAAGEMTSIVANNIIIGFSGVGAAAIRSSSVTYPSFVIGHNAFYNNTANYSLSVNQLVDLTANDVVLAADPFTDAANGDFSLTAAAKTALAAKGWPTAYLGAHANTVPNLNIGPIQMAASAGGGGRPAFGDRTGGKF